MGGRYHLHIADGGEPGSTVTAATLFAHLTLRCGHLRNFLLLSASTTDAKRRLRDEAASHVEQITGPAGESADDKVLRAAESLLRGDDPFRDGLREEDTAALGPLAAARERIVPYPFFSSAFAESEEALWRSGARYFDFIATADVASFDYLLDYYLDLRSTDKGLMRRKVGLVHILCSEPARAGHLLQRFLEMILDLENRATPAGADDENEEDDTEEMDEDKERAKVVECGKEIADMESCVWLNRVDSVVAQFYQLLGVDVLFTMV